MPCLQHRKTDLQVDVLHALPGLERRLEHRGVVVGGDAGVVEQHVDAAELLGDLRVHLLHRVLLGHVDGQREVAGRAVEQVDADDLRALALERLDGRGADAAGRARDDATLPSSRPGTQLPSVL